MGEVTFSETLGMLEAGNDHNKLIENSKSSIDYFACVSSNHLLLFGEAQADRICVTTDKPNPNAGLCAGQEPLV